MPKYQVITESNAIMRHYYTVEADSKEDAIEIVKEEVLDAIDDEVEQDGNPYYYEAFDRD